MWKNSLGLISAIKQNSLLFQNTCIKEQIRTTFILKRKFTPLLHKKGNQPKKLKAKHYVYELVKHSSAEPQENINVILTSFVEGLGNIGEKVSIRPKFAYNHLILPRLAVYDTPENEEKYKNLLPTTEQIRYSSPTAFYMIGTLSRATISVIMSKDHPWTIKPWHIKVSLRKCCYIVPEEAITIPDIPIKGPDMNLESKEFYVTVTINKTEKVNVRCRIHHWSTEVVDRIPYVEKFWEIPVEPVHSEFKEILDTMPPRETRSKNLQSTWK